MRSEMDARPARDGSVLSAIISLILGAILGVAASALIDNTTSLLIACLSSAAIVAAAVLAFVAIALARTQNRRISDLAREVARVGTQVGEPADLTFERFERSTGEYFRRLQHAVEQLRPGDHVFVMTHHMRPVHDDAERNEVHSKARKAYLDALLKKAAEGVVYRRILCFEPINADAPFRRDLIRRHIREHCLSMMEIGASTPGNVVVKKAPALLMADIFIINHELGAISMETDADSTHLYTAGALIVHDPPNGRIIDQLRAWWDEAYANSTVVRKADLTEAEPATAAAG